MKIYVLQPFVWNEANQVERGINDVSPQFMICKPESGENSIRLSSKSVTNSFIALFTVLFTK